MKEALLARHHRKHAATASHDEHQQRITRTKPTPSKPRRQHPAKEAKRRRRKRKVQIRAWRRTEQHCDEHATNCRNTRYPRHHDTNTKSLPTSTGNTTRSQSRWSKKKKKHTFVDERRQDRRAHKELSELKDKHCDPVTINETCRTQKEELWREQEGHTWASTACHGTAVLIHKRWKKHIKEVHHSGPRLLGVTIERRKLRLQIISGCFPHTGYGDQHVQPVCSELQQHINRCRKKNTNLLVGEDFNAQVGMSADHDGMNEERDHSAVGSKNFGAYASGPKTAEYCG